MQQTRSIEMGTGLFVLLGMAALFFLTTQTTGSNSLSGSDTFEVTARFDNVGSLKNRAPVRMSGFAESSVVSGKKATMPLKTVKGRSGMSRSAAIRRPLSGCRTRRAFDRSPIRSAS